MLIYQGSTDHFLQVIEHKQLLAYLTTGYQDTFGRVPERSEVQSWRNSLPQVGQLISTAGLTDGYIALEYEVPYSQNRIDCLLFGRNEAGSDCMLLLELKQWSQAQATADKGNFVETYTGGMEQRVAHPSQQAKGYHSYLQGFVATFEESPPLLLFSCAYFHNYYKAGETGLFAPAYEKLLEDFSLYTADDMLPLAGRLRELRRASNATKSMRTRKPQSGSR